MSDHLNDPDPLELVVKTYQGHAHSKLAGSKTRMDVDFPTVDILLIRQSLKPLRSKFSDDEKRGFDMDKYITKESQKLCWW